MISVPAYFNDNQRSATKLAAQLAGRAHRAAGQRALGGGSRRRFQDTGKGPEFLVFDFGGGTLDVSVVDCFDTVIEIAAVAGDNRLGGNDFDEAIARHFCKINGQELAQLSHRAGDPPQTGPALQGDPHPPGSQAAMMQDSPKFPNPCFSNNKLLLEISAPFFPEDGRVIAACPSPMGGTVRGDRQGPPGGGSCHMPVVQSYIAHLLGREIARLGSPDTVVAQGWGLMPVSRPGGEELKDIMMTDVCPLPLGWRCLFP